MTEQEIRKRIDELVSARGEAGEDPAAQVEAALFVEEVFGLKLSDHDMTEERLGTAERMTRLVLSRLGRGR